MYAVGLIALSVSASVGLNLSYKKGAQRSMDAASSPALMCFFVSLFLSIGFGIAAFIADGGIFVGNSLSFGFIAMLGAGYSFAAFFYIRAMSSGPFTLSVVFLNLSAFMPTVYSSVFLGEELSPLQIAAIAVIIGSCVALTVLRTPDAPELRATPRWILFITLTFLANGFISFSARLNTVLTPETSEKTFFSLAYALSAVICLVFYLVTGGPKKKLNAKSLAVPAVGIAAFLSMQLIPAARLPGLLPAALQYPLVNGSAVLVGVFVGALFFREKLPKLSYLLILTAVAAMAVLSAL